MPNHFVSLADFSGEELRALLGLAHDVKRNSRAYKDACQGQSCCCNEINFSRTRARVEGGLRFHVLPCGFNRQLCRWWYENGYAAKVAEYFTCAGPITILHGNCKTPFSKPTGSG